MQDHPTYPADIDMQKDERVAQRKRKRDNDRAAQQLKRQKRRDYIQALENRVSGLEDAVKDLRVQLDWYHDITTREVPGELISQQSTWVSDAPLPTHHTTDINATATYDKKATVTYRVRPGPSQYPPGLSRLAST
jgi:hypothetical protein